MKITREETLELADSLANSAAQSARQLARQPLGTPEATRIMKVIEADTLAARKLHHHLDGGHDSSFAPKDPAAVKLGRKGGATCPCSHAPCSHYGERPDAIVCGVEATVPVHDWQNDETFLACPECAEYMFNLDMYRRPTITEGCNA